MWTDEQQRGATKKRGEREWEGEAVQGEVPGARRGAAVEPSLAGTLLWGPWTVLRTTKEEPEEVPGLVGGDGPPAWLPGYLQPLWLWAALLYSVALREDKPGAPPGS